MFLLMVFRMLLMCLLQNVWSSPRHHSMVSWNFSALLMAASMQRMDQSNLLHINYSNRCIYCCNLIVTKCMLYVYAFVNI